MAAPYRFAPVFLIRLAGVAFDCLEKLATPESSAAARDLLVRQEKLAAARARAKRALLEMAPSLTREQMRAGRKALRPGVDSAAAAPDLPLLEEWRSEALQVAQARQRLEETLPRELEQARKHLLETARTVLPRYLVFVDRAVRERLLAQAAPGTLRPRNKDQRAHERHLLLYLQRVCAKNDSLSEFGPEGWGTIEAAGDGIRLSPRPGIAGRETFLERWTAHGAAAAMNADPEVRPELAPRLHPHVRVSGAKALATDTGELTELDATGQTVLAKIDGRTPAHSLGFDLKILQSLAARNIVRWEVEIPALDPHAFTALLTLVQGWRSGPTRSRWLDRLQQIAQLPKRFAESEDAAARFSVMDEARTSLDQVGVARGSDRFLYSASNPVGEECFRDCGCVVTEELVDRLAEQAEPWFDLWRDSYAFVAGRVAAGLRGLLEQSGAPGSVMPLPAFLRHCAERKMSLTGPGLVAFAHLAFQEVKAAFRQKFANQSELAEYELSAADCHFVRENFRYEKFDEYTYPSADVQLAAVSAEAVAKGNYQWILAELHPPVALLHHGFFWSCPDKKVLAENLLSTVAGRPNFHFGFFAADFTSATAVHVAEATPGLFNFVAPQPPPPGVRAIHPAETEVYVEEGSGDVCLRRSSGEHLGSFARAWVIPLGFHPFAFSLGENTPRLRCGSVIVQRRSWTVKLEELGQGDFTGVSRSLVLAIEKMRAKRELPRHVYIRPTEQALRRSGAEGRDKDTKPVYIDFESYLFLEIFHRWLVKAGELEVTEMLPAPEQLLWREPDGRRTFELRTQVVPKK